MHNCEQHYCENSCCESPQPLINAHLQKTFPKIGAHVVAVRLSTFNHASVASCSNACIVRGLRSYSIIRLPPLLSPLWSPHYMRSSPRSGFPTSSRMQTLPHSRSMIQQDSRRICASGVFSREKSAVHQRRATRLGWRRVPAPCSNRRHSLSGGLISPRVWSLTPRQLPQKFSYRRDRASCQHQNQSLPWCRVVRLAIRFRIQ